MLAGIPKFILKDNYAAWQEVIQLVEDYLKTPHDDSIGFIQAIHSEAMNDGFVSHYTSADSHNLPLS